MGKRELIALLNLSSWCLVMVERLFLTVPRGCLQFVIVVFPDHTHLLYLACTYSENPNQAAHPHRLIRVLVFHLKNRCTLATYRVPIEGKKQTAALSLRWVQMSSCIFLLDIGLTESPPVVRVAVI